MSMLVQLNPHNQPLHLDIADGFLNLSVGVMARLRAEIVYGLHGYGPAPTQSLDLSLAGLERFRVNFETSDRGDLGIALQAHTVDGRYSQASAQNPSPGPAPSTLDLAFKDFGGAVDLRSDIISRLVWFIESTARAAIRSFEIV